MYTGQNPSGPLRLSNLKAQAILQSHVQQSAESMDMAEREVQPIPTVLASTWIFSYAIIKLHLKKE